MDWGMEQMMAMDQATTSSQRVRWTENLCEIGNTIALNLKKLMNISFVRVLLNIELLNNIPFHKEHDLGCLTGMINLPVNRDCHQNVARDEISKYSETSLSNSDLFSPLLT